MDSPLAEHFGRNLWRARRRAGLSQGELARLTELHRGDIGKLRENGLWLCATHGEGIDDEERYTVALLVGWREIAEVLARAEQGRADPDTPDSERRLVPYGICIDSCDEVHRGVQEFLEDVGANRCWGRQRQLGRMVLTELALNAFEHGRVEQVEVEASGGAVTLRDKGDAFGIEDLKRGGTAVVER
jgi:hypothetical protein